MALSILVICGAGVAQAALGQVGWAVCVLLAGFTEGKRIYLNPSST